MASGETTNYFLPYPILTDTVNVHGDIQSLAEQIDAVLPTIGLPYHTIQVKNTSGANITNIKTTQSTISLGTVTGSTSAFTVKVLYPSTYSNINQHKVQILKVKSDGTPDYSNQIAIGSLDGSGMVTFYNGIKVGDSVAVVVKIGRAHV